MGFVETADALQLQSLAWRRSASLLQPRSPTWTLCRQKALIASKSVSSRALKPPSTSPTLGLSTRVWSGPAAMSSSSSGWTATAADAGSGRPVWGEKPPWGSVARASRSAEGASGEGRAEGKGREGEGRGKWEKQGAGRGEGAPRAQLSQER